MYPPRPDGDERSTPVPLDTSADVEPITLTTPLTLPPKSGPDVAPSPLASLTEQQIVAFRAAFEQALVRTGSMPPPPPHAPRSSIRVAAKGAAQVGKWGVFVSGALTILTSVIVALVRPEYAVPLAQVLKLIAALIMSAAGGGAPAHDAGPARDVPVLTAPAPLPPPLDGSP